MNKHDGKWGNRKYPWDEHPIEVGAFTRMQHRVNIRKLTTTVWPRTTEGFFEFLEYIGPAPKNLLKPSLGRKDHKKGYQPGNVFWQEWKENWLEGCYRGGLASLGRGHTEETKNKMSIIAYEKRENRVRASKIANDKRRKPK